MNKSGFLFLVIMLVVIAVLSVYRHAGECEFIGFDDDLYVSENHYVQQGLSVESLKWAFTATHASTWQPLVWLSYMVESQILGHEITPGLFHWTNLLLHAGNTVLLFYLLYLMTGLFWPSFFVCTLFGLHPVHVESVVWVAERKDVLSTLFWLLTLIFYVRYTRAVSVSKYIAFTLFFTLGLMAKPMLVTIPIIMLILDYWPLDRSDLGVKRLLAEKIPLLLPVAISCVITVIVQKAGGSVASLDDVPALVRFANVPVFYSEYIFKLFWPNPLAVLYLHPGMPSLYECMLAILFLTAISISVVKCIKSYPFLVAGWLWFIVTMFPVIGLISFGLHGIADRFLYIPAIGIYIMIAWSGMHMALSIKNKTYQYLLFFLPVIVIVALAYMTSRQIRLWQSNVTLFSHAISVTPDNWAMHNCLGAALDRQGDTDEALECFEQAVSINTKRPRLFYNLGCALQKKGRIDEAIDAYRSALDMSSTYMKARYNIGVALEQQERFDEALKEYQSVQEADPANLMTYNNMGTVYVKQGRIDKAQKCYLDALDIDPNYLKARYNLGAILFQKGQLKEAAFQFTDILRKQPDHQAARQSLSLVLDKMKQ